MIAQAPSQEAMRTETSVAGVQGVRGNVVPSGANDQIWVLKASKCFGGFLFPSPDVSSPGEAGLWPPRGWARGGKVYLMNKCG